MLASALLLWLGTALADDGRASPTIADILADDTNNPTGGVPLGQYDPQPPSDPASSNNANSIGSILGVQGDSLNPKAQNNVWGSQGGQSQQGGAAGGQSQRGGYGQNQGAPSRSSPPASDGQAWSQPPQQSLNAGSLMSSLLGGNMQGGSSGTTQISEQSRLIVSGIVESFMHKIRLLPGEKTCLENNVAQLAADVVGTGQDLVSAIKAIVPNRQGQPQIGPGIKMDKDTQGTLTSAGMDGAIKLTSLVTLSTSIMKNCVQGDALAMLNATARHFIDMRYVGHRLLVSGVDIAHSMSDGIMAYEQHDWRRFGADIGTSLRKVLLSNSTKGTQLPEGVPEQSIIQQTTEGLMDGFFVTGSTVEVTDAVAPNVDVRLDLHRCIAGNQEFFKEIFLAIWSFIAQMSVNGGQHGFQNPFTSTSPDRGQPKWMGQLMLAMMQVPMALGRCSVGRDNQQMMLDAIKSIQYWHVDFQFPRYSMRGDEAARRMALAINKWTTWDFKGFGKEIGRLLREFVLTVYPQAYSVDASGRLRRQLIGKSASSGAIFPKAGATPLSPFLLGGLALTLVVSSVAVRSLRAMARDEYRLDPRACDAELGGGFMEVRSSPQE